MGKKSLDNLSEDKRYGLINSEPLKAILKSIKAI